MKSLILVALIAVPAVAHADDITKNKGIVSADFELLPTGTISGSIGGFSGSTDANTAYGVGLTLENQVNELVSIGLAPRFLFGVKGANDTGDSSNQIDIRARVAAGHDLIPKLRVYGFGEPGYSIIFPPSNNGNGPSVHPNGFVIAAGGGLSFELSPTVRAMFELGYQWGFQSWSYSNGGITANGDLKDNFLSLGFGLSAVVD